MSLSSIPEFEIPEFKIPEFKIKLFLSLLAFTFASQAPAQEADIIFIGQHIITVDENSAGAEAVAVKDGRILAIGDRVSMLFLKSEQTRVVELGERALLPGFIDAHGRVGMQSRLS